MKRAALRCSLRRRAAALLSGGTGQVPAELAAVLTAICSARNPRTALNWMRAGAGAAILADLGAGRIAATHEALDQHPRPRAAGYLRQMLVAGAVPPPRDEELARAEQWLARLLASMTVPEHRRLVRAFATWQVMPRLRRTSQARRRPRTYTARARNMISTAIRFLSWLGARGTPLPACRQADIDDWLTAGPGAADVRDFLAWAARQGHCQLFDIPRPPQRPGTAIGDSQRWDLVTRLLHDESIQVTDRVARCLVLLFGQNMTRVAAMTTSQVTRHGDGIYVQFGLTRSPSPALWARCCSPSSPTASRTPAPAHPPSASGYSPGCCPASRSPRPASPGGSAPSASPSRQDAAQRSPGSPPSCPPPCSPTPSACNPEPPSDGCTTPELTGTATPLT